MRRLLLWALLPPLLLLALAWAIGCALSGPRYQGPPSDHFDGRRFHNLDTTVRPRRPGEFWRWISQRTPGPWRPWTDAPPGPTPPRRVHGEALRVTFVNHATALIQTAGLNLLTDPIWSSRASPVSWAGPRRVRPPGLHFAQLPPIDLVLVSHNHYDHLDLPTLRRLHREHGPLFVVGLGNGALLRAAGIDRVLELDWWQRHPLAPGITLTATPAQHFSARGLCDRNATLWVGYHLDTPAGAVFFAGDTGYGDHFRQVRQRLGAPRLALLPIGAYRPTWFMARVHVSPAQAVRAALDLGAGTSVGIHFGTFRLADDGQDEPVHDLRRALRALGEAAPRFWTLDFGEGRLVPPLSGGSG